MKKHFTSKFITGTAITVTAMAGLNSDLAFADQYLIDEMESLKGSLDKTDPDRVELSLRLADLYFDVSIQEGSGSEIVSQRNKAYNLYHDVLNGRDGLKKPSPAKAIKIKYQMARVLGKLSRFNEARDHYSDVYESKLSNKQLKKQAAFALAEYYEAEAQFKNADNYYKKAIALSDTIDSKNYAHYKRAWLLYKEVLLDEAIVELKKSLWDSKGQARDKVINDMLLFFSAAVTDGKAELAYIQDLIKKTGQKDLVRKLVESFYGAGNRIAGSNVLVALNEQEPDAFYEMRLLEEYYGFRTWDKVDYYLGKIEKRTANHLPQEKEEAKEFKAMLKRVIVQLGAEAETIKERGVYLRRTIDTYLSFYENDDMRKKLQQGWLKVQDNKEQKIDRLAKWIKEDISFGLKVKEIRKLRQTRLALAQELKKSDIIVEESMAIAEILKGTVEAREFRYVAAQEQYNNKEYDKALPLFIELADLKTFSKGAAKVDKWAIQSQNLVLDIYNSRKNYDAMVSQASLWTGNKLVSEDKGLKKEMANINKIQTDASFEKVAALGETAEALAGFYAFCFQKVYEEKACANAKVLSIKLKDQEKLISLLEKAKDEKALMNEYELMGRFSDAAALQEKFLLTRNAELTTYLKIAVMYELDQNSKERDRILTKLMTKLRKQKTIDKKLEPAIYLTLKEANLLNERALLLPWSLDRKLSLAHDLEVANPSKRTQKILLSQTNFSGPAWSKLILDKLQKPFEKQGKISFYGRSSKWKFKKRIKAIEKFASKAKGYLEGSDSMTRIYILDMLKKAYVNLSVEIMSTPLPEGLTEEIMMQVQANLTAMATPYSTVGADYERLQNEELAKVEVTKKEATITALENEVEKYSELVEMPKAEEVITASLDFGQMESLKTKLNKEPGNLEILSQMENFYKTNNKPRIAAYFTGRINSLKE